MVHTPPLYLSHAVLILQSYIWMSYILDSFSVTRCWYQSLLYAPSSAWPFFLQWARTVDNVIRFVLDIEIQHKVMYGLSRDLLLNLKYKICSAKTQVCLFMEKWPKTHILWAFHASSVIFPLLYYDCFKKLHPPLNSVIWFVIQV